MDYAHPVYTPASVAAQRRLPGLNTRVIAFAGAYHGWGFHEDGCRSGAAGGPGPGGHLVSAALYELPDQPRARPAAAARVPLPQLPVAGRPRRPARGSRPLRPLARFRARDHLGDPARPSAPTSTVTWPRHGIDLAGGRVLMLAHARVLGYVFNPLTVFWCHRPDGDAGLRRGRGAQHLRRAARATCCARTPRPRRGPQGRSTSRRSSRSTARYRMRLPEPDDRLRAGRHAATAPGGHPFVATVRGRRRPGHRRAAARAPRCATRGSTAAVSARIRWQGIAAVPARAAGPSAARASTQEGVAVTSTRPRRPPSTAPCDRRPGPAGRTSPRPRPAGPRGRGPAAVRPAVARLPHAGPACRTGACTAPGRRRPRCCSCTGPSAFFRRLGAAGLIGFGEAYMAGDWDSRRPGRAAHRVRRARCRPLVPRPAAAAARAGTSRRSPPDDGNTVGRRAAQHPPPLRPVQRAVRAVPRRDHDLLVGAVRTDPRRPTGRLRPRRGPAPQDRPAARPGRRRAGHPAAGDRHRLGRAGDPGRRAAARTCHAVTISARAARAGRASGSPAAGLADRVDVRAARLPRASTASYDAIVSVEMIEAVGERVLAAYFAAARPAAGPRRPGRRCRRSRCRTTGCSPPGTPTPGSRSTSSPAACSRRSQAIEDSLPPAHRAADRRPRWLRRALRRDAAAVAANGSRPRRRGRRASASTRRSAGCGTSTWPTPRPASAPATSTCTSSSWPGRMSRR